MFQGSAQSMASRVPADEPKMTKRGAGAQSRGQGVRATAMANAASDGLAGDPKWFSHCVVMLNTCIPSRGSKEKRIGIPLLEVPNIYSK